MDRNVIRVGVFELVYRQDIPASVSLNEAVDLGKKYGSEDSGSFINGILDRIRLHFEELDGEREALDAEVVQNHDSAGSGTVYEEPKAPRGH